MRRAGDVLGRRGVGHRHTKQLVWGLRGVFKSWMLLTALLVICVLSLWYGIGVSRSSNHFKNFNVENLWRTAPSDGWRPSSAPRFDWPPPPNQSNGYLRVRCNGGLNQQRSAICNAVLAARLMNATLVLPELDTNSFWHDESGFSGIYDVEHFIQSLRFDVQIIESLPEIHSHGRRKKMKSFQIQPPRDAPPDWYTSKALEKMKEHGAIYLTPFSHRLAEDIDDPELQRLRCRVNYHALKFKPKIMQISNDIVRKLRAEGHFVAVHLRFEMDMLAFAGCLKIFTPEEQKILKNYREKNFKPKELEYETRRAMGKCPLTPEEVGLILRSMGFGNSTRIYIASGEIFGGDRFMKPFRALFPRLENHNTVSGLEKLEEKSQGLMGSAVDYMVCLLSDVFMPTYDGPSNFANNILGHRLYYGFRAAIQPDRKALAPIFIDRENGRMGRFEERIRQVMFDGKFGGPHKRYRFESFYTNSWPECFCQISAKNPADRCPPENTLEILDSQLQQEEGNFTRPPTVSEQMHDLAEEV